MNTVDRESLPVKMRRLADVSESAGYAGGARDLRDKAEQLEDAIAGFYGTPQTVKVVAFLGAWARARKLYCDHTGEPLI